VKFDDQGSLVWEGEHREFRLTVCNDIHIDSNFSVYITGYNGYNMVIMKNPGFNTIMDPNYSLGLVIIISSALCISALLLVGTFFCIRFLRRSPKKVMAKV
jgi:hypothetical protein